MEIALKCKIYLKTCKAVKKQNQSHHISVAIFSNFLKIMDLIKIHLNLCIITNVILPFFINAEANEPRYLALGVLVVTVLIIKYV